MRLQDGFDVLKAKALSDFHDFIQDAERTALVDQTDEDDLAPRQGDIVEIHLKVSGQHLQAFGAVELCRCFEAQALVGVGLICSSH